MTSPSAASIACIIGYAAVSSLIRMVLDDTTTVGMLVQFAGAFIVGCHCANLDLKEPS